MWLFTSQTSPAHVALSSSILRNSPLQRAAALGGPKEVKDFTRKSQESLEILSINKFVSIHCSSFQFPIYSSAQSTWIMKSIILCPLIESNFQNCKPFRMSVADWNPSSLAPQSKRYWQCSMPRVSARNSFMNWQLGSILFWRSTHSFSAKQPQRDVLIRAH